MSDSRPWRQRNLERIAEARRILKAARAQTILRHGRDAEEGPDEGGGTSPDPEPE